MSRSRWGPSPHFLIVSKKRPCACLPFIWKGPSLHSPRGDQAYALSSIQEEDQGHASSLSPRRGPVHTSFSVSENRGQANSLSQVLRGAKSVPLCPNSRRRSSQRLVFHSRCGPSLRFVFRISSRFPSRSISLRQRRFVAATL